MALCSKGLLLTVLSLWLGQGCSDSSASVDASRPRDSATTDGERDLLLDLVPPTEGPEPTQAWVVWSSNREDARHEIYIMRLDSAQNPEPETLRRLTNDGGQRPSWSPDGRWIAYYRPKDHTTQLIRPDGSDQKTLTPGFPLFWKHDNSALVCADSNEFFGPQDNRFFEVDLEGNSATIVNKNDFTAIDSQENAGLYPGEITADGRWMISWVYGLFRDGREADNGSFKAIHATVALDLTDTSKLFFVGPGCSSATPPSGPWIYHVSREGKTIPDIYRLRIDDLARRESYAPEVSYPDAERGHEYMPRISNDGRLMVYMASNGCHDFMVCDYEIFVHQLGAGVKQRTRLTHDESNDNAPDIFVGDLPQ